MSYKNEEIKSGSKWVSDDHQFFQVIHVTEIENKTWVYYRKFISQEDEYREYSCYAESFLQRFTQVINE